MKLLISALTILIGTSALASNILNCQSRLAKPNGPIVGTQLTISQEPNGKIKGLLYPICPRCMVKPKEISFDKPFYQGTVLVYQGKTHILEVSLESLVPTKNHPAVLSNLVNRKKTSFNCQSQD